MSLQQAVLDLLCGAVRRLIHRDDLTVDLKIPEFPDLIDIEIQRIRERIRQLNRIRHTEPDSRRAARFGVERVEGILAVRAANGKERDVAVIPPTNPFFNAKRRRSAVSCGNLHIGQLEMEPVEIIRRPSIRVNPVSLGSADRDDGIARLILRDRHAADDMLVLQHLRRGRKADRERRRQKQRRHQSTQKFFHQQILPVFI